MKRSDISDEQVVRACINHPYGGHLLVESGWPPKVVTAAMERADRRGLIDYGVSLWTAWPTPEGRALLAKEEP